ncbi:MAG TPA: trypsin-like peptidase domain-containing protein [Polyangia bacterium]
MQARRWAWMAVVVAAGAGVGTAGATPARRTPIVEAVQRAAPAVVSIAATVPPQASPRRGAHDDLSGENDAGSGVSIGSGVLFDSRGYVVTNEHVISGANQVKIQLSDRREFTARVVGADARFDLAVLKIDAKVPLPAVRVGTARDLMPGETVIAIGNPFGLTHTVSTGVVSALHRVVPVANGRTCEDCIQIDAAINPGNSGGALLNIDGELIGINAAIRQNANNIGFAIPVDRAQTIVSDLIRFGRVRYGWIGIYPRDIIEEGVAVSEVEPQSPAARAGVKAGDVILGVGELPMVRAQDYTDRSGQFLAEEEVALRLARGVVRLKAVWLDPALAGRRAARRLGLELATALPAKGTKNGPPLDGVRVVRVTPRSLAATAGIRPGDMVRAVNQQPIRSPGDYQAALAALKPGGDVVLAIQRGQFVWYVPLQV